jgi:hypothetical protein
MGRCLIAARAKPVTGVTVRLMQGRTGVFAERMQGRHLYVLGYSASVFGERIRQAYLASAFGKRIR